MFRKLKLKLRALFRRNELDDEIVLHVAQLTAEFVAQGMSLPEARSAAIRQFGSVTVIQEQCRELSSFGWLEDLVRDVHYAGRVLRRAPSFYAGATLVLALGIGANCAVFNLAYSVLLKPLPYERPEEIVMVWDGRARPDGGRLASPTNSSTIQMWRNNSAGVFSDLAVMSMWDGHPEAQFDLALPDRAERLRGSLVTPNFFSVLGARAVLGRVFLPADEAGGHYNLIMLSYGVWQRFFGGDPGVIGRAVTFTSGLSGKRAPRLYTVIGVLPLDFRFTYPVQTEVWALMPWREVETKSHFMAVFSGAVARLGPGVSPRAAQTRMAIRPAGQSSIGAQPVYTAEFTLVQPIADWVSGKTRPSILLVSAVAFLLLVIACATVANALFVRVAERKRELAIRASQGAGRGRLMRQLLTEGLLISLIGTTGGVLLTTALLPVLRSLVPASLPRAGEMAITLRLLVLPATACTLVAVLVMLAPAFQGARLDLAQTMKSSSGAPSATRWRFVFVAVQTTVATSLLVGAALLLTSFWRLHQVDLGFDGQKVLTAEMRLLETSRYSSQRIVWYQQELVQRVRALPGVLDAGLTSSVPFRERDSLWTINAVGRQSKYNVAARQVDPGYFSIMRISLRLGRLITDNDTSPTERVGVISESLARQVFPNEDPIGKRLEHSLMGMVTVVGVVRDARYEARDRDPVPAIYLPRAQNPWQRISLVVRISGDRPMEVASLRSAIHEIDPTVPVLGITTIDQIISDSEAGRRFYTTTVGAFAALALALTGTGLVVIVARSVAERRRELAIRSALGAQGGELVTLVVQQGLMPVILGATLGLFSAWFGARVLEQFLFGVRLHDLAIYAGAGCSTIMIAAIACLIPARRAAQAAPAEALMSE
jgi:putative ABC transport system permease protein